MLIGIYMARFINRQDIWGKQWVSWDQARSGYAYQAPSMDTKAGRFPYEQVTPDLVRRHFAGQVSCAWSAIDQTFCSIWLCFDSDTNDGALDRLESFLKQWRWHLIREGRRSGRDGHLWVLFDGPVPATQLIILGDAMIKLAGVNPKSKQHPKGIERFPRTATGYSQVRGPLGINLKPEANGARGWFDGAEHDLKSQLEWLASQALNSAQDAIKEAEKQRSKSRKRKVNKRRFHNSIDHFQVLDYVQARPQGGVFVAQCPLCSNEGHDTHQDNLRIRSDGSVFCCVYGGPNEVHKVQEIIASLLWKS